MLALTFGSSILATSAVVAGFMGGMGIGAWLYHWVAARIGSPLRAYAYLEIAIAISTALLTFTYLGLPHYFAAWAPHLPPGIGSTLIRVATVFLLLLIPSAIMGATYPALCRALIHSAEEVEGRLGWIYGLNTLGAAAGALVAGFLLIEALGSSGAVRVANAINLLIGVGTLLLVRRKGGDVDPGEASTTEEGLSSDLPQWIIAVVLFGSGFATLGYEMVWFRALHYLMGPGTYVLSTLLAIFLLGLGFGAFLYRPALRVGRPEWNLGFSQLGLSLLAILAIGALNYVLVTPGFARRLSFYAVDATLLSWQMRILTGAASAFVLMLPATLWMGLSFPLASRLFLGDMDRLTSRVGLAYLLSNLGSITGAIAAAVWVLPAFGSVGGTRLFAAVNLALGLLVLLYCANGKVRLVAVAITATVILLGAGLPERLAMFNHPEGSPYSRENLIFEEESDRGTVQVFELPTNASAKVMNIDGATIAATRDWNTSLFAKQLVLAHLPMTLDRGIRHTLNLGVASATTLATLARYPWIESLDAVEINPAVIRGARAFAESKVFEDPRSEIIVEDALHYLLSTDKRYDLIINDAKGDARSSGTSKVLARELYQYSFDRLSECGVFAQRIVLNHGAESLAISLRTLRSVFPVLEVFVFATSEVLMIGSRCPIDGRERPSRDELEALTVASEIRQYFLADPTELRATWVASGSTIDEVVGEGPINDWNKLPLEYLSYRQPLVDLAGFAAGLTLVRAGGPNVDAASQPSFAASPFHRDLQVTNRVVIAWLEGRFSEAQEIFGGITRPVAEMPLVQRAIRELPRPQP